MLTTISLALSAIALSAATHDPKPVQTPAPAPSEEVQEEAKEEKKICRRVTDGTGSRRKVRLCLTKEEWVDFNRGQ